MHDLDVAPSSPLVATVLLRNNIQKSLFEMEDEDALVEALAGLPFGLYDCPGCPPPVFNLPPPPRPPWLDDPDGCGFSEDSDLAMLETCDAVTLISDNSYFEDTFHSVAVVLVSAVALVILLMVAGVVIFRRRKLNSLLMSSSPSSSSSSSVSPNGCGSSQRRHQHHQDVQQHQVGTDQLRTINSKLRLSTANPTSMATMPSHPNHYISDLAKHHQQRQIRGGSSSGNSLELFSQRFGTTPAAAGPGARLELARRPPSSHSAHHNFPHIIIGGQPFYLIPSDDNICATCDADTYAYPPNTANPDQDGGPIYEEIDPDHDEDDEEEVINNSSDVCSASSERGEAGSLQRPEQQRQVQVQHHHQHQQQPRVLVNPLVRDVAFSSRRHFVPISESVSPSSCYKPRPPLRSPATTSSSQSSSSIYYYSDTLRKKDPASTASNAPNAAPNNKANRARLSDEFSDSGFSNRSGSTGNNKNKSAKVGLSAASSSSSSSTSTMPSPPAGTSVVDTKIVFAEIEETNPAGTSTLV